MAIVMSKDDEIVALRVRVRELEDEIAAWREFDRDDLSSAETWECIDALRRKLGVYPRHARLLMAMAASPGRILSKVALTRAQGSYEDANIQSANVSIVLCRKSLSAHGFTSAIETVWGCGYRLTPEGAAFINTIIAPYRRQVA